MKRKTPASTHDEVLEETQDEQSNRGVGQFLAEAIYDQRFQVNDCLCHDQDCITDRTENPEEGLFYEVKWAGFPESANTWEHHSHLAGTYALNAWHARLGCAFATFGQKAYCYFHRRA